MSWDALLTAPPSGAPTADELMDFFSQDENVEINAPGEEFQASYENEDTGVHFLIDHCAPEEDKEGPPVVLSFNLNYLRPYFFALEAMPLLVSLARQFDLKIIDAQEDGQPSLPEPEVLIESWNKSNDWAVRSMARDNPIPTLPRETSNNRWFYAINREKMQEKVGEDVYVPKLFAARRKGEMKVFTLTTWGDAMSMVFPPCDQIAIVRKKVGIITRKETYTKGILPAADVLGAIRGLLKPFEGPIPGMSILPPENQKAAQAIYKGFKEEPFDPYEALASHQYVDVV